MQIDFVEESQIHVMRIPPLCSHREDECSQLPVLHVDIHRYEGHCGMLRQAVAGLP